MVRRIVPALAAMAFAALVLAGCATPAPGAGASDEPTPADPAGQTVPEGTGDLDVDAAWLHGGSMIAVVTYGSSACLPGVDDVVLDEGVLVVSLTPPTGDACTEDLVPQALAVGAPEGVDPGDGLEVQVLLADQIGTATLAPYAGGSVEDYAPSAGWAGDEHVAILTWGSSSCAPTVESSTVVSPTEVVVTFATPRADQVCTMDMAPRVAVATLDGDVSRDATLTLGGMAVGSPGDDTPGAALPIG